MKDIRYVPQNENFTWRATQNLCGAQCESRVARNAKFALHAMRKLCCAQCKLYVAYIAEVVQKLENVKYENCVARNVKVTRCALQKLHGVQRKNCIEHNAKVAGDC